MPEFTFTLPSLTVNGVYEPADATPQQVLSVFTTAFLASDNEPGAAYEVDSFVRMSYVVDVAEPPDEEPEPAPAAHKAAAKHVTHKK